MPPDATIIDNGSGVLVTAQDVIVASWVGRVESFETPVASLANKALDNIQFLQHWGDAGGSLPVSQRSASRSPDEGTFLSSEELALRVFAPIEEHLGLSTLAWPPIQSQWMSQALVPFPCSVLI